MARREMWMGPRDAERWVPVPSIDADFSRKGFNSSSTFINGGGAVRSSYASQKSYGLAFRKAPRDQMRVFSDMKAGQFDTREGVNPIYLIDPAAADKNVAPQHLASPYIAAGKLDGMPLTRTVPQRRPSLVPTPTNSLDYPGRSAFYSVWGLAVKNYIPIPPGFVAWVGFHGSATGGGGVRVTPFTLTNAGTPTTLTPLAVTDTVRVNASFSRDAEGYTGIEIDLLQVGTLTASGIIVQILPQDAIPEEGGFISGQGNSGLQFDGDIQDMVYSVALDLVYCNLTLVETGAWL